MARAWSETEFVAFDLETTGLDPADSRIVEIAGVRFGADGEVLGEFQQLVDPGCRIPSRVIRIHGITNEAVAGEPGIDQVLPRFREFLGAEPALLMAHHARFDLGFLAAAILETGLALPAHPVIDTCALARRRLPLHNYKLETLGRYFDLIETEEHRALADARLLKDVFLHLVNRSPAIRDVARLFELAPPRQLSLPGRLGHEPPAGYELLWEAMREESAISIRYMGGSTPGATRVIRPLQIRKMRGRLYVCAYCYESECDKTFRLDRISSAEKVASHRGRASK